MARVLINLPRSAKRGELIEIRTLIQHGMETGYRPGPNGVTQQRDIIRSFTCLFDNEEVFHAELYQAIAANPFITFSMLATASGILAFTWTGDNGFAQTETRALTVT
ncbi:MAG: soxZ [Belnapia sp.]|nr:soxZ [Belnapia sp.]